MSSATYFHVPRPLLLALALLAASCGLPAEAAPSAPPPQTVAPASLPAAVLSSAATATEPAERLSAPTTQPDAPYPVGAEPVVDCRTALDTLPWEWRNPDVGLQAYRIGAACRNWPQDVIDKWEPFVHGDVWARESGWCWNLIGGGTIVEDVGCIIGRHGTGEDAGIGQLTAAWWGRDGLVCKVDGWCGRDSIVASPYDSVMAALAAIEHGGDQGYCYSARARAYHPTCADFPPRWP